MEFDKLKVSDTAKYWYEVAAYVQPYAAIGSLILGGLSFLEERNQSKTLSRILNKLVEIEGRILECKNSINKKIEDVTLRRITGEVLGMEEILKEYCRLRMHNVLGIDNILVNMVTASVTPKNAIRISIEDQEIHIEHRGAYCGLYCTLLPLRATAFELLGGGDREDHTIVREEILDLLAIEKVTLNLMDSIGRNRVSLDLEVSTVDVYKTQLEMRHKRVFSSKVDGVKTIFGTVISEDPNEGRRDAELKLEELADEMADASKGPFQKIFDEARRSMQ